MNCKLKTAYLLIKACTFLHFEMITYEFRHLFERDVWWDLPKFWLASDNVFQPVNSISIKLHLQQSAHSRTQINVILVNLCVIVAYVFYFGHCKVPLLRRPIYRNKTDFCALHCCNFIWFSNSFYTETALFQNICRPFVRPLRSLCRYSSREEKLCSERLKACIHADEMQWPTK